MSYGEYCKHCRHYAVQHEGGRCTLQHPNWNGGKPCDCPGYELEPSSSTAGLPCPVCRQVDAGQAGEYPCGVCGVPTLHDAKPSPLDAVGRALVREALKRGALT